MIDLHISSAKTKDGKLLSKLSFLYIEVFFRNAQKNKRNFMQLDTGANLSIIFSNKMKELELNSEILNSRNLINSEMVETKFIDTSIKLSKNEKHTVKRFYIEDAVSEEEDIVNDFEITNNVV